MECPIPSLLFTPPGVARACASRGARFSLGCKPGRPGVGYFLEDINHILRDHRTGEVASIDTGVLDFLHAISRKLGSREPFHIISGYRSPATNAILHARSRNVATNSFHVLGKAVDIRLPDVHLRSLRRAALDLSRGGVGYYPKADFVHVDVGRVRSW